MKAIRPFLIFCMILVTPLVFAQEMESLPINSDIFNNPKRSVLNSVVEKQQNVQVNYFQVGDDLYTCKVLHWQKHNWSFGLQYRMEDEVLPYANSEYEMSEAYYFDVSCRYAIKNAAFKFSIDNLLDFNNNAYSIDPFLVGAENVAEIINFSHEPNFLISLSIAYNL